MDILTHFSTASRIEPRCPHAALCGGCSFQQFDYQDQLRAKEAFVKKLFAPLLVDESCEVHPIMGDRSIWRYRNKMEFSFSQSLGGERFLGLMMRRGRGRVLDLGQCHLAPVWFTTMLEKARHFWKESLLPAYNRRNDQGALRTLTLREGMRTGCKMVFLTVSGNPAFALKKADLNAFVNMVREALPNEEVSIFLRIHQIAKGHPTQFFEMHLHGPDHIREELLIGQQRLCFKISPTSFFQPNTLQAEQLFLRAVEIAGLGRPARIVDLFSGTASLSMAFALFGHSVTAIELNPYAVMDAEENKQFNQIADLELICGDVGKVLKERGASLHPDLVIVDPPRAGLDSLALEQLLSLRPEKILYISCNPVTQVENVAFLCKAGYRLRVLQPIDQFPHTPHVENIALLQKID
jgi:23S rRNA (uracil1939-C5)-methyltransferase